MYIGQPLPRDEDRRFLTGLGEYTDDIEVPNLCLCGVCAQSPGPRPYRKNFPGGRREDAGSFVCSGCRALGPHWVGRYLPAMTTVSSDDGQPIRSVERAVFAIDRVCYVGDTVAAVVAETLAQALDAAENIDIDYEPLSAVSEVTVAAAVSAPRVHECFESNHLFSLTIGNSEAVAQASTVRLM